MLFVVPALGMAIGAKQADQPPRGLVGAVLEAAYGDDGLGGLLIVLQAAGEGGEGEGQGGVRKTDQGTTTVKATESVMLSSSSWDASAPSAMR